MVPPVDGSGLPSLEVKVDTSRLKQEDDQLNGVLRKHPKGYVIVVFKASHYLYLAKDGKVVERHFAKKSDLGAEYAFLKNSLDDQLEIDFPMPIALGRKPVGPKLQSQDRKTPEGEYFVCRKDGRGQTDYTVGLEISYPNLDDAALALKERRITPTQYQQIRLNLARQACPTSGTSLGWGVKIHGPVTRQLAEVQKTNPVGFQEYLRDDQPDNTNITDKDWTFGCIALERVAVLWLFKTVPNKTPVVIFK